MSTEVVKCCYNCKNYHFYSGICDIKKNMPPVDLKLPCKDFKEGVYKHEANCKTRKCL